MMVYEDVLLKNEFLSVSSSACLRFGKSVHIGSDTVVSESNGTVVAVRACKTLGYTVFVDDGEGLSYRYCVLKPFVRVGSVVLAGEKIGSPLQSATGNTFCLEVMVLGVPLGMSDKPGVLSKLKRVRAS